MKTTLQTIKTLVLALIIASGVQFAAAAWTSAPASPPSNNVDAPINVGAPATPQQKAGALWLNTTLADVIGLIANGTSYFNGNVGIYTNAPSYPLQVRRTGGAGSLGVSIDNAMGASTRDVQYFAIGDVGTAQTGHAFYVRNGTGTNNLAVGINSSGNVGVGTASPAQKLDVVGNIKTQGIMVTSGAAAGRVLTATDALGNTTWSSPGAASLTYTLIAEVDYNALGYTDIGTHVACFVAGYQNYDTDTGWSSFGVYRGVVAGYPADHWVETGYRVRGRVACID